MTRMVIGEKVVSKELCEKLDKLNAEFIELIGAIANDVYGDEFSMTDEEWDLFQQDFFVGFVESVMCVAEEAN